MRTYFFNRTIAWALIVLSVTLVSCVNASRSVKYIRVSARVESITKEIELTSLPPRQGGGGGYCMRIEFKSPMQLSGKKLEVLIHDKFERKFRNKKIYPTDIISFDVPEWIFNTYSMPLWFYELRNIEVSRLTYSAEEASRTPKASRTPGKAERVEPGGQAT